MLENIESSQIQANAATAALLMSVVVNIVLALKWWVERCDTQKKETRAAKIDEFEQLSKLLKILNEELDKREKSDREKDTELAGLKAWRETLTDKLGQARKDLWDVSQSYREIKRFLASDRLPDDLLLTGLLQETERKIEGIIECLKR